MDQEPRHILLSLEEIHRNAIPTVRGEEIRKSSTNQFIKGPIPYKWLTEASRLSSTVLRVGLILWFLSGLTKSRTVKLSNRYLKDFGVHRVSKYGALKKLQDAGLITYEGKKGSSPIVTVIEI